VRGSVSLKGWSDRNPKVAILPVQELCRPKKHPSRDRILTQAPVIAKGE
jgi:hypothetical protein